MNSTTQAIYARVKDGKITEYPVTMEQIKARGLPQSWYVECTIDDKPIIDELTYAYQVPVITDNNGVRVTWKTSPITLDRLLNMLPFNSETNENENPLIKLPTSRRRIKSNNPPTPAMVAMIKKLTEERIQTSLDNFAKLKGYDSIERAISYIGDKNETWDSEGKFCRDIRSDTWTQLQQYFSDVTATPQVKPYPNRWEDITKNLPKLEWPGEVIPAPIVVNNTKQQ